SAGPVGPGCPSHLAPRVPVAARLLHAVAAAELNLTEVELVGPDGAAPLGRLEQLFRESLREYWPYLPASPRFDASNTDAALPDIPPPTLDRAALARLIRFAVRDQWGRRPRPAVGSGGAAPGGGGPAGGAPPFGMDRCARARRRWAAVRMAPPAALTTSSGPSRGGRSSRGWHGLRGSTSSSGWTSAGRAADSGLADGC